MQLLVRGSSGTYAVNAESTSELWSQIVAQEGSEEVSVFATGNPVDASTSLEALSGLTLDVNVKLLGGKVHGSLARAGKVRGQTPKVEAQEKKKKKTGRAKRRIQYNRRFVNVVQSFGRRRGPNSNS
uniref:40S ribosomal protein S30 n=1 Tax=Caligus rogercresseyi TaxID=217165 RepID=C1BQN9_CALRO|nr:40S ribosomal protein S30 [Caligus rogercresseyi]